MRCRFARLDRARVYVRSPDSGELVFHALAAPSAEELTDVAARTAQRVQKITTNDLFGCGSAGVAADEGTCRALDRTSEDLCGALPDAWRRGDDGFAELANVRKRHPEGGGVLCCRD